MVPALALACHILLLGNGGGQQTAAQTSAPSQPQAQQTPPAQQTQTPPPELPSDLNRIKEALSNPPKLNLVDKNPFRFYTDINRTTPTFSDMVGSFDLFNGPVPHSGMTHQEFVQSTRPKDLFSSAGFTPGDVIRWGLLTYAEGKAVELLKKGIAELNEARTEAERKQIRARIERELAALRGDKIK
jgi:hypothetical protein